MRNGVVTDASARMEASWWTVHNRVFNLLPPYTVFACTWIPASGLAHELSIAKWIPVKEVVCELEARSDNCEMEQTGRNK